MTTRVDGVEGGCCSVKKTTWGLLGFNSHVYLSFLATCCETEFLEERMNKQAKNWVVKKQWTEWGRSKLCQFLDTETQTIFLILFIWFELYNCPLLIGCEMHRLPNLKTASCSIVAPYYFCSDAQFMVQWWRCSKLWWDSWSSSKHLERNDIIS